MPPVQSSSAPPHGLIDRQVEIETPEHVAIGYDLADLGSRFTALLLDALIMFVAVLVLWLGVPLLVGQFGELPAVVFGWGGGVLILLGFALVWGYFVYFEGLRDGQTPGKRMLGIRVIHDGGYPLTFRGAAVRNLLRIIDIQPVPSWLVGGLVMLLHPRTQRLGDLAAGSVVVRERTYHADAFLVAPHPEEAAGGAGDPTGHSRAAALVERQRDQWEQYRSLLRQAERRGLDRLPEREVSRFAALYRETAADLARARTYGGSADLLYTLERLVGAGHNLLYRPAERSWQQFRGWVIGGFPALVRLRWRPIALAAAFFYLPALLMFAVIHLDPASAREVLPAGMIVRAEEGRARQERGQGYIDIPEIAMPVMASSIIANNVQVTFVAFAGGILAGLGTVLVLVFNGVFLGAVVALFVNNGLGMYLGAFVLPHGVIELTAIAIAGGAGLWLGSAILLPGRLTRREALVTRGREAVSLLGGTTLLLLVAGAIEGFISPARIPDELKFVFAALFAAVLALYLLSGTGAKNELPAPGQHPK